MRTHPTDDELAVREVFAGFFANESTVDVVRSAEPGGHDPALWEKLTATGAPGMAIPAEAGGGDATLRDLGIVVEEWGAHLAPVPLVEHAAATRLLHAAGADPDLVRSLAAGARIATLALRQPVDDHARLVPSGAVADVIVAHDHRGLTVTLSDPPDTAPRTTGDLPLADRDLTGARTVHGDHAAAWARALDEWRALMAIAHIGLARRALGIGVAYVKERHQFGVPVGSFQAVQHGFADAATRLEGADLLANRALWALDTARPEAARLAGMALLFCSEAARFTTERSLQYHGGYGYAEEYDIQLYHRRATSWILQLGDPGQEYARLADLTLGSRTAA